ncbi:MAG: hypothetical protein A3F68_10295 [Acidobacteria bacterium RIFCSPLOWO2_12_FULL_54_10]|nr:MAG: hypothetical protein A3F68_10295 [Acidobacteria bacterium RIFCSPLOWO2_12_FULL_54_10]
MKISNGINLLLTALSGLFAYWSFQENRSFMVINGISLSNGIDLILTALVGLLVCWTYQEQRRTTYMQFYEIIAHHHKEELTELRREVMNKLPVKAEVARTQGTTLFVIDANLHLKTSALADYYEGLGTFLQGGWKIFPATARNTMLALLHHSVSKIWPLIDEYKDQIHPKPRASDWAGSYHWLYDKVVEYRKQHNLQSV